MILRRDLLRLAGLTALTACGDNISVRAPDERHAMSVLEPSSDALLVAVWAPTAQAATLEVHDGGLVVARTTVDLDPAAGRAAIDVLGLQAGTRYEVTVTTDDGVRMGPTRVRTAPADDDPRPVTLAVSGDLDVDPQFATDLLAQMSALDPEVYISLGDFPYTDNGPPAVTVAEYRARHADLRTDPRVRAWLDTVGVRAIYDDHEFRNDWDAMFEATEHDRFLAAMQVWDEFFPLRETVGDVRYRAWRWGAHVEYFQLDCRRFRSANAAPDDANKTMLGATQKAWLLDRVAKSTATFKIIGTTVPLDFGTGDDHWASFQTERDQILDALVGIPGILFVTADQHFFAAHRHAHGIREFQLGPLARGFGTPGPMLPGVLFRHIQYNFGYLEIDGETLTMTGVGPGGERFYKETLSVQDLTPTV